MAKLFSRITDCGIKLPPGMKKAQILRIYMDNCARGDMVEQLATEVSIDTNAPFMSTSPMTRWEIAAELQRQRGLPTPAVTTSAAGISTSTASLRVSPDDETLIRNHDSNMTAQPLADVVRKLQRPGPDRSRESPRPVTDPGPVTRSYPGLATSPLGVTACPREIRPGCPIFAKVINNAYILTNVF